MQQRLVGASLSVRQLAAACTVLSSPLGSKSRSTAFHSRRGAAAVVLLSPPLSFSSSSLQLHRSSSASSSSISSSCSIASRGTLPPPLLQAAAIGAACRIVAPQERSGEISGGSLLCLVSPGLVLGHSIGRFPSLTLTGSRVGRTKGAARQVTRRRISSSATSAAMSAPGEGTVVSTEWLAENLSQVKVLDASWYMPAAKRSPADEFLLPHMLPSAAEFAAALSALGVSSSDRVVVYDGSGIFSAARAWWMFRASGHDDVAVLEGGLPKWRGEGRAVERGEQPIPPTPGSFVAELRPALVRSVEQVLAAIEDPSVQIVDARGAARFQGKAPEPRAGVRGGHIPGSFNVPFTELLTSEGALKPAEDLKAAFSLAGVQVDQGSIVASCGTGITACVLSLALKRLGRDDVAVYDGSWTEWGGRTDTPVEC